MMASILIDWSSIPYDLPLQTLKWKVYFVTAPKATTEIIVFIHWYSLKSFNKKARKYPLTSLPILWVASSKIKTIP